MTYAPIVLFVYNRPDHTRRTVEGLLGNAEAKESLLYIFADGPKEAIPTRQRYLLYATTYTASLVSKI